MNVSQLNKVAANQKTSSVKAGTNVAVTTSTVDNNTEYTVNANGTTASAGSNAVKVSAGTKDSNNITDYQVDLSDNSKASLAKADSALQNIVSSNPNLTVQKAGNTVTLGFSDNPEFTTVKTGDTSISDQGLTIKGGPSVTKAGIHAGNKTITGVADGVNDTDAVNVSQLKNTVNTAAAASKETITSANKTVGIKETTNPITGAKNFDLAVNTGNSLKIDSETGAIDVNTDGSTIIQTANGALTVATTTLTPNKNGTVTAGNTTSLVTANTVANAINNSGFNLTTSVSAGTVSGTTAELINPGKTVTFDAGKNIALTQSGNKISVATKEDVEFTKATANTVVVGSPTGNRTTLTSTANGLDIGGDKITNVAAGTLANDAVNVSQLNAAKTEVVEGDNIKVVSTTGSNGQTIYKVSAIGGGLRPISINGTTTVDNTTTTGTGNTLVNGQGSKVSVSEQGEFKIDTPIAYVGNTKATDTANATNTVKLVGAGTEAVQIINMASGVRQANDPAQGISDLERANRISQAQGSNLTNGANIGDLRALGNSLQNNINNLGYKLGDVEQNANAGTSAAMATAALPQAYLPGKSMLAGGMATYNGEGAAAIGVSKLSDNGRWVIKVNGTADTQGNFGGAVGAGFHW